MEEIRTASCSVTVSSISKRRRRSRSPACTSSVLPCALLQALLCAFHLIYPAQALPPSNPHLVYFLSSFASSPWLFSATRSEAPVRHQLDAQSDGSASSPPMNFRLMNTAGTVRWPSRCAMYACTSCQLGWREGGAQTWIEGPSSRWSSWSTVAPASRDSRSAMAFRECGQ